MGILRPENRRYNAHFVFYKPIKISLLRPIVPLLQSWGFIARLSSAQAAQIPRATEKRKTRRAIRIYKCVRAYARALFQR